MLRKRASFGGANQEITEEIKRPEGQADSDDQMHDPSRKKKIPKDASISNICSSWCAIIGWICTASVAVYLLYQIVPFSVPEFVSERITGPPPDSPGVKLAKEGLRAFHPVVFVPGIVTGGLELWEGLPCSDGLFRKRLWGGTFGDVYKRPSCWVEHLTLDNKTGLDPEGIRVRAVSGLVAADYFAPGYYVWAVLIENMAKIGYEEKSMYMATYDWRLSFQHTEVRDKTLSQLKRQIETLKQTNEGRKVVVVAHSMGTLFFMHFLKWVEAPLPMGGGGGPEWVSQHLKATMNIAGPLLGVPKALPGLLSAEVEEMAVARSMAPQLMDSALFALHTLRTIMSLSRTWDSTMSMIPRGGEIIWGSLESSPDKQFNCSEHRFDNIKTECHLQSTENFSTQQGCPSYGKSMHHYGRLLSFGKGATQKPDLALLSNNTQADRQCGTKANESCEGWIEYDELDRMELKAAVEGKVFTANTALDLLKYVAPRMMQKAQANWAYGIADDLDDQKYQHHKYWSNPLETKLPFAPNMEIYCSYGVGILTERSYVYKMSADNDTCSIPIEIDASAEDEENCLKKGAYLAEGDETVPTLSAGLMCAQGWRGKTRFNPSNSPTFIREYKHSPPSNILEGRGTMSAGHVDILGNYALIEDIMRVAAGASGDEIGGDRIYSDILKWAEHIPLKL